MEICLLQNYVTTAFYVITSLSCYVTSFCAWSNSFPLALVHGTLMHTHYLCQCICIFKVKPRSAYQAQINTPRVKPCIDGSLRSGTLHEKDLCTGCRSSRIASTSLKDLLLIYLPRVNKHSVGTLIIISPLLLE